MPMLFLPGWLPLSVATWGAQMIVFHAVGLAFETCDRHGWLQSCKVRTADRLSYSQLLPRVLFNQSCVLLPAMVLVEWLGLGFVGSPELSIVWFLIFAAWMAVGHDVVMYLTHRFLLHSPRCRWLGHHVHHSTDASRAISACYMSAPDFLLEIACPYLVPLALFNAGGGNVFFHLLTASAGAIGGLYEHSGYDFSRVLERPELPTRWRRILQLPAKLVSSHAHSQHHARSLVSFSDGFGSPGICDTLLATRWDLRSVSTAPYGRSTDRPPATEPASTGAAP